MASKAAGRASESAGEASEGTESALEGAERASRVRMETKMNITVAKALHGQRFAVPH